MAVDRALKNDNTVGDGTQRRDKRRSVDLAWPRKYVESLPETDDRPTLSNQFEVFCSALIAFSGKYNLRYPLGD
jgi:hypothetical protein